MSESGNYELRKELPESELSERVIGAAIAVQKKLGAGYIESFYENAMCVELEFQGIPSECQKSIPVYYREKLIGEHRLDLFVDNRLVIELKAIKALEDIHFSIVLSYMKAAGVDAGLIFNFATMPLTIKRVGRELSEPNS